MLELGGLDVISFSGGIGENSDKIRSAVCKGLEGFGIKLDEAVNGKARKAGAISMEGSRVKVLIMPADEEIIVARETVGVVEQARVSELTSGGR
jgi:acetate kinase